MEDENVYTPDQQRVAKWLVDLTGIGGGEDPIDFLMASYVYLIHERNIYKEAIENIGNLSEINK